MSGATSGIGQAVAWELAAHGAALAVGFRSDPGTAGVAEALGPVDLVVCNAGVEAERPLVEMSLQDWRAVVDVDLCRALLCSREGARAMIAPGGTTLFPPDAG